ncbi:MAG: gliding motility-associated C-terminal domain-containing protein [Pedobacter sp.]|nr:gliding motility-associated C-terminal domain-containing protein [Chitinophagaceae bacterium]
MKKLFIVIIFLVFIGNGAYAAHLKGGWIQYEYLGPGSIPNSNKYKIIVRQYLLCTSNTNGQVDNAIYLGIFDGITNVLDTSVSIPLSSGGTDFLNKTTFDPCISNQPSICYRIDRYEATIELQANTAGYILAVQRCCRIPGIINVTSSGSVGISYINKIPGSISGIDYSKNSSPSFAQKDTAVICYGTPFTFDFSATDVDLTDSISYTFCDGLTGGSSSPTGAQPNPAANPPYASIPYANGLSGSSPLGNGATINAATGIISGIAPSVIGDYVVAVCAYEYRGGVLIGITKKEIHITVANCQLSGASLNPTYLNCNDLTFNFSNLSTASNIISYLWTFGEPASGTNNISTQATPTHIYKDTGTYITKLKVVATGGCIDSATTQVGVFPGFVANFKIDGSCLINPYQFTDLTVSKYGIVNNWTWDFGETSVVTDTSTTKNPKYLYPTLGSKTATLTVKDTKGCQSVVTQTVVVFDKPTIVLPFRDTLICSIDTLQLFANSSGSFSWLPTATLINPNTANPFAFPKDTTTYYVTVNNNGCINTDSITVNVLDFITVNAGLDTSICQTDTIRLRPISYALSYVWKASTGVAVDSVKNPLIKPLVNTYYYITANLGKCQAKDTVAVVVNPYPISNAGTDAAICFGNRVQLNGNIVGNSFSWSPTTSLINITTLTPTAGPTKTTNYILTTSNITGCLKPVSDTIIVTVVPIITVFAGRDTTVVVNQPLQLNATSTSDSSITSFVWLPTTGLNNSNIYNPIATLNSSVDSIRYKVRATTTQGCFGEDDILVRVYKTEPDIFVPSGFTPNGDGRNDILKAIPVGIVKLDYFNVYNRFGQLLYSSPEIGKGWDGNFSGSAQPSGTYVYVTQGTDYLGKIVFRKGTAVLIR